MKEECGVHRSYTDRHGLESLGNGVTLAEKITIVNCGLSKANSYTESPGTDCPDALFGGEETAQDITRLPDPI